MAKRKKEESADKAYSLDPFGNARVEFVVSPEWLADLDALAEKMGLSRSAFIRLACNRLKDAERRSAQ